MITTSNWIRISLNSQGNFRSASYMTHHFDKSGGVFSLFFLFFIFFNKMDPLEFLEKF
jgi:hypothetical protein